MTNGHTHQISIMIVALNEARHLPRLIHALHRLILPPSMQIETILIDGGSTDGTPDMAREMGFSQVHVMKGANIPVCRNAAIRHAHGEWLAFLDGDCEPASDWLLNAMPFLQPAQPVLLGYPVLPPADGQWIQRAWHAHWKLKNRHATATAPDAPIQQDAFRLIVTRNMLFTRKLLDIIPSFDEKLSTGEDTDFAFRATNAGCAVLAVPGLKVIHYGEPATLREFYRQQLWHSNRSVYLSILKSAGGVRGANAVYYSLAFLTALIGAIGGLLLACTGFIPACALALLPLLTAALPALKIAWRARSAKLFMQLLPLYFLYGLARSVDLLGFSRRKKSWKTAP